MKYCLECDQFRDVTIATHHLRNLDEKYHFFYDESNNIRVFRITQDGFNYEEEDDFVLGGIVYKKDNNFSFDDFVLSLRLQKSVREIKRHNIAKGNSFLECMKSRKLEIFLKGLLDNDIYIHFFICDCLYFSILDIIEDIWSNRSDPLMYLFVNPNYLRSIFYKYFRKDINNTHKILFKYQYPDMDKKSTNAFCNEFITWINTLSDKTIADSYFLNMIKSLFQDSQNKELILCKNNSDKLIEDFTNFYLEKIYKYHNSDHVFDIETEIMQQYSSIELKLYGKILNNYEFIDSKNNIRIQISDVVAGIICKLTGYVKSHDRSHILVDLNGLNEQQKKNIKLLNTLILKSDKESDGFFQYIISLHDLDKLRWFFNLQINT